MGSVWFDLVVYLVLTFYCVLNWSKSLVWWWVVVVMVGGGWWLVGGGWWLVGGGWNGTAAGKVVSSIKQCCCELALCMC